MSLTFEASLRLALALAPNRELAATVLVVLGVSNLSQVEQRAFGEYCVEYARRQLLTLENQS
jgi:hypothetical protein